GSATVSFHSGTGGSTLDDVDDSAVKAAEVPGRVRALAPESPGCMAGLKEVAGAGWGTSVEEERTLGEDESASVKDESAPLEDEATPPVADAGAFAESPAVPCAELDSPFI